MNCLFAMLSLDWTEKRIASFAARALTIARMLWKIPVLTILNPVQAGGGMLLPSTCRALSRVGTAGMASMKEAASQSSKVTERNQKKFLSSSKKERVPRALAAYNFFIKEQAPARKRDPGVKPADIMTLLGREWRTLSAQQKRPYESLAAKSKADVALAKEIAKSKRAPLSAYNQWCSEVLKDLKSSHPTMKGTDKMKEAAARWKLLPVTEKERRTAEARAARLSWSTK